MENKAGKGSIAAREITNSFIQIINQNGDSLGLNQAQELEHQYLKWVIEECKGLEWLDQVKQQDEQSPEISLDSVYTALLTTSSKQSNREETFNREGLQPYSAVEMLNRESRLVITGAPGSGKSALVNFFCICMAGEWLGIKRRNLQSLTQPLPDEEGQQQDEPQVWDQEALIPLRIILRDFASSEWFPKDKEQGETSHLINFIKAKLDKSNIVYFSILQQRLRLGHVLFMLDGLDEVPQAGDRRNQMLQCIKAFEHSYSDIRILVTARPYAYGQADWKLANFQETALADFTKGQICLFVDRWYSNCAGLDEEQALNNAAKLKRAIFNASALIDLTKRPLLLTLVAFLHSNRYDLPDHRADLYERLLELLIEKWEKARFKVIDADDAYQREQFSLAEYLQVGVDAIRIVLERLAFEAHASQSEQTGTADIAAEKLSHELMCLATGNEKQSGCKVNPIAIGEYLRDRVGILYQRGGANDRDAIYTFPHRSFQEYLAAAYFRREEKALFDRYADTDHEDWWELAAYLAKTDPDRWREVVVLAGGIRSHKEPGQVWSLLDALVPETGDEEILQKEGFWGLRLAVEILAENVKRRNLKKRHQKIMERIQRSLPQLLSTDKLNATERVAAGKYLAQ